MANPPQLEFRRLNHGWNAEPNAPSPKVDASANEVSLRFEFNHMQFPRFEPEGFGVLTFPGCTRWRLGSTNDEGWYRGQCRYSGLAPAWGEFYEIVGDDPARDLPIDWRVLEADRPDARHFLFYLRDETFECMARDWLLSSQVASTPDGALNPHPSSTPR